MPKIMWIESRHGQPIALRIMRLWFILRSISRERLKGEWRRLIR